MSTGCGSKVSVSFTGTVVSMSWTRDGDATGCDVVLDGSGERVSGIPESCVSKTVEYPYVTSREQASVVDRMVKVVREFAGEDYTDNFGPIWTECRVIAAFLPPEPVDPLLERARKIAADVSKGPYPAPDYMAGQIDDSILMRGILAALRVSSTTPPARAAESTLTDW